ncbi:hypothetical protein GH714_014565 [Hevea brasiliensis]|uniref:Cyclic nucleotide-binding domain-containing protein n=1 Tax=Hevea brasiliensis TaxID=3981 RepID=A0A6A6LJA1_HEVBR|nr:hypothetical protein GH714_014565 [Hevea brasiliensis]
MGYGNSRSVRFKDDLELAKLPTANEDGVIKLTHNIDRTQISESSCKKSEKEMPWKAGGSLKAKVLSRVFSEDYEGVKKKIFDPRGPTVRRWTKIVLVACLVSLFVDPLFFYLPVASNEACIVIGIPLEITLTIIRTIADIFYMIQIFIHFQTAYVAPSSRVFGRGELVIDSKKIAVRYLKQHFWIDLIAALPLPQLLIWFVIPNLGGSTMANTKNVLRFIIIFQYLPRLFLILPLSSRIINANGVVTETAWAGAAYNLMLYMLASHQNCNPKNCFSFLGEKVLGACWYLLSIERQEACWRSVCNLENPSCRYEYFDCHKMHDPLRESWFKSSNVTKLCNPDTDYYQLDELYSFGDSLHILFKFNALFIHSCSSLGQNLSTTTYVGEITFAVIVATLGLVLFALLIGNMQGIYGFSLNIPLAEILTINNSSFRRVENKEDGYRTMDASQAAATELKQSVRKYDLYKWWLQEELMKRLFSKVPLFDQMDERMLDAICERLKPALSTEGTFLVHEGDLVNEMLFIIRGHLDSYTTNGGRTGFFNSCRIGPGDFCGEELLTWALDPRKSIILPSSTRTAKAISEVEAFALRAEDLKFVASQFRRLHSKQLRHKFRFYSHQWRTWAACFIQAAWHRYKKQRTAELRARENPTAAEPEPTSAGSGLTMYAARRATSTRRGIINHSGSDESVVVSSLQKPAEPDFSVDED